MIRLFVLSFSASLHFSSRQDSEDERCAALGISLREVGQEVVLLVSATHVLKDNLDTQGAVSLGCQMQGRHHLAICHVGFGSKPKQGIDAVAKVEACRETNRRLL